MTASLADALAMVVAADHQRRKREEEYAECNRQAALREQTAATAIAALNGELSALHGQIETVNGQLHAKTNEAACLQNTLTLLQNFRGHRLLLRLRRLHERWAPRGSCREQWMYAGWHLCCGIGRLSPSHLARAAAHAFRGTAIGLRHAASRTWTVFKSAARPVFRRLPTGLQSRIKKAAADLRGKLYHGRLPASQRVESIETPGLVSVVLPVYNQAAMLRAAVESVLTQTYRDFELILVNDGSNDGVENVLAEYVGHPQVRILTQANQTLPKALSNGFEFARGEFWTWTSADNVMLPDQLRRQVAFLQSHPEVGMVFADYTAIDAWGQPLADPSFRPPQSSRTQRSGDSLAAQRPLVRHGVGQLHRTVLPLPGLDWTIARGVRSRDGSGRLRLLAAAEPGGADRASGQRRAPLSVSRSPE